MTNKVKTKEPYLVVKHSPTNLSANETREIVDYSIALLIAKKMVAMEYKKMGIPAERKITKAEYRKLGLTGNEPFIKELSVKDEMKMAKKEGILRMWRFPNSDTSIYISIGENIELPALKSRV